MRAIYVRLFAVIGVALSALGVVGFAETVGAQGAPKRRDSVAIVSPSPGTITAANSLDIVIAFSAIGNFQGLAVEVGGHEAARRTIAPNRKSGTETFTLHLGAYPDGALTLRAFAWQGTERARLVTSSQIVTINLSRLPDVGKLAVTSTPDESRRVSANIGILGGSLTALDDAGVRYELTIPAGELVAATTVSLAPTSITGLSSIATSTRYAVDFAPSGLVFAVPATLRITPPAGAPPFVRTLTASWSATPGIELGVPTVASDGSLLVTVTHFSGVTTLASDLDNLLTLALVSTTGISASDIEALRTQAAGLPGTTQAVVDLVMQIYAATVAPAMSHAAEGTVQLRVAARRLREFAILYQLFPIGDLPVTTAPPATDLDGVYNDTLRRFTAISNDLLRQYVSPACSATVGQLAEWFVVPIAVVSELALIGEPKPSVDYCASATVEVTSLPATIEPSQPTVAGSLRGVVRAPAQTPGGTLSGGVAVFPQPTVYGLHATNARFAGGTSDLSTTSGADGVLSFVLDRGPEPRAPRVAVAGTARIGGFWTEVNTALTLDDFLPIDVSVGPPPETRIAFRDPPVDRYLAAFGSSQLCVDLSDAEGNVLATTTVEWTVTGPGSVVSPTTVTDALGVTCTTYSHLNGFVVEGVTSIVTARANSNGVIGTRSVTLLPQWAHIELEIRPGSAAAFVPATNSTISLDPTEGAEIRFTLTVSGPTPADPPVPTNDVVGVGVNGGGKLYLPDGSEALGSAPTGEDGPGIGRIRFDPDASTGDTEIRVFYSFTGPSVVATVLLDRTRPPVVTVSPVGPTLAFGQSFQFAATVQNAADPRVTWSATGGAIDQTGNFTAGATAGPFTVKATSVEDPTISASVPVQVLAVVPTVGRYKGTCTDVQAGSARIPYPMDPTYGGFDISPFVTGTGTEVTRLIMPRGAGFCGGLVAWLPCLWNFPIGFTGGSFSINRPSRGDGLPCQDGTPYPTHTRIDGTVAHGLLSFTMYVVDDSGESHPYKHWDLHLVF